MIYYHIIALEGKWIEIYKNSIWKCKSVSLQCEIKRNCFSFFSHKNYSWQLLENSLEVFLMLFFCDTRVQMEHIGEWINILVVNFFAELLIYITYILECLFFVILESKWNTLVNNINLWIVFFLDFMCFISHFKLF